MKREDLQKKRTMSYGRISKDAILFVWALEARRGWGGKEEKMVVGRNKTKEVSSQTPFPSDGSDFRPSEMKIDFLSGLERYMRW